MKGVCKEAVEVFPLFPSLYVLVGCFGFYVRHSGFRDLRCSHIGSGKVCLESSGDEGSIFCV